MNEANNLPKAISHKKLSLLKLKAKKDNLSFSEEINIENKQMEDFLDTLDQLDKVSKAIIKKMSFKNENIFKTKSSNSIMALGAMEVHLNMALQAMNVFKKDEK